MRDNCRVRLSLRAESSEVAGFKTCDTAIPELFSQLAHPHSHHHRISPRSASPQPREPSNWNEWLAPQSHTGKPRSSCAERSAAKSEQSFPNNIKLRQKSSYRNDSSCPHFSTSAHSKLSMPCTRRYSLVSLQSRQTILECCVSGPKC